MNHRPLHRHPLIIAALLAALLLPRCLMASERVRMASVAGKTHQSACHTAMQETAVQSRSTPAAALIHCAQQCEHSHVGTVTDKPASAPVLDQESDFPLLVATFDSPVLVTAPRQGWPPDGDNFIPSHSSLYLNTARLRL